jgi:hypothetical protein
MNKFDPSSFILFPLQTVQKDARADLNVIEKRIRQQETDVERMKDEYHRELLRLRNLIKQKEIIISRLQQEKTYVNNFIQFNVLLILMSRLYGTNFSMEGPTCWLHCISLLSVVNITVFITRYCFISDQLLVCGITTCFNLSGSSSGKYTRIWHSLLFY